MPPSKIDCAVVKAQGFLRNKGADSFSGRILTITGRLTADQVIGLSEAAKKFGAGQVSFTTRLNIEIPGIPFARIPAFKEYIAAYGLITGGTGPKVRPVVACKGGICQNGLIDTLGLCEEIFKKFVVGCRDLVLPNKFKIGVGGCPNNCAKPDLNDLGITARMTPALNPEECQKCGNCLEACPAAALAMADADTPPAIDKARCLSCGLCVAACSAQALTGNLAYKMYLGGRWGKQTQSGQLLRRDFATKDEVLNMVDKVIKFFVEQGQKGERISGTIDRLGFKAVEKALLD